MKILSVSADAYEDNKLYLYVELLDNEIILSGQTISIEMMDDSICHTVAIKVNYSADKHNKIRNEIIGPCNATIAVLDIPYHEVKTEEEIRARQMLNEVRSRVCITPFREIRGGEESIYDYVQDGYAVPNKVIEYLRSAQPYMASSGIYEHPFKPGEKLTGPYLYTDGHYYWDSNTWEYVIKYHLTLPQEFINHILAPDRIKAI